MDNIFIKFIKKSKFLNLIFKLGNEAGLRHLISLSTLILIGKILEITGLGIIIKFIFDNNFIFKDSLQWGSKEVFYFILVFIIIIFRGVAQSFVSISQEKISSKFGDKLRNQFLKLIIFSSSKNLNKTTRGELYSLLMVDITRSVSSLDQFLKSLDSILTIGVYFIGIIFIGDNSIIPLFITVICTLAAAKFFSVNSWGIGLRKSNLNSLISSTIGDGISGWKTLKSIAGEKWLINRFSNQSRELRENTINFIKKKSIFGLFRDTLIFAGIVLWIFLSSEKLNSINIATTLLFTFRFSNACNSIIRLFRSCKSSLPGYQKLLDLRNKLSIKNKFDINKYSQKDFFISICNNSTKISYIRFKRFINNKFSNDLNFNSGDIIVIKGISGSGKTSFLDSFIGLTVNEKNSWEINCKNKNIILDGNQGFGLLNQIISYSPQVPTIFETSLFENLLLGDREIDFAPSKKDIDMINFWLKEMKIDYLSKREFELNKSLKLSLNPFSAGEMQRLCLIRTFLRNKQIEVHDEPTSNLDLSATKNIRDIFLKRSRNRFTLIATHDPILINIATKVISL